ncbi:MAG: 7TM diverse intracellular signaling domain-containing protein [Burkholderiaceae bacterium]
MLSQEKNKKSASIVESRPEPWLERIFFGALLYLPLIAIGLVSLMAFAVWSPEYPQVAGKALRFRALEQTTAEWTPQQALQALSNQAERARLDTRLSEAPFWLLFQPLASNDQERQLVEFASRHLMEIACWDTRSLASVGQADREKTSGRLDAMKAGFVLDLGYPLEPGNILCRASFIGPARLTVLQWPESQLQLSAWEFQRNSGLLEGGLLMLALFMLFIAVAIRNKTYLLFSVWLFVNLRMAAFSAGWNVQWLGRHVPVEWETPLRAATLVLFYALTAILFFKLFENVLANIGYFPLQIFIRFCVVPLSLLAIFFLILFFCQYFGFYHPLVF